MSWLATAEAVVQRWADNRVPVRYAERTLEEAIAALDKSHAADASRATAAAMDVVRHRDRAGVANALGGIRVQRSALDAKLKSAKGAQ